MIHWLCSNNLQVPLHMNAFTLGTLNTFEYATCGMVSYLSRIITCTQVKCLNTFFLLCNTLQLSIIRLFKFLCTSTFHTINLWKNTALHMSLKIWFITTYLHVLNSSEWTFGFPVAPLDAFLVPSFPPLQNNVVLLLLTFNLFYPPHTPSCYLLSLQITK